MEPTPSAEPARPPQPAAQPWPTHGVPVPAQRPAGGVAGDEVQIAHPADGMRPAAPSGPVPPAPGQPGIGQSPIGRPGIGRPDGGPRAAASPWEPAAGMPAEHSPEPGAAHPHPAAADPHPSAADPHPSAAHPHPAAAHPHPAAGAAAEGDWRDSLRAPRQYLGGWDPTPVDDALPDTSTGWAAAPVATPPRGPENGFARVVDLGSRRIPAAEPATRAPALDAPAPAFPTPDAPALNALPLDAPAPDAPAPDTPGANILGGPAPLGPDSQGRPDGPAGRGGPQASTVPGLQWTGGGAAPGGHAGPSGEPTDAAEAPGESGGPAGSAPDGTGTPDGTDRAVAGRRSALSAFPRYSTAPAGASAYGPDPDDRPAQQSGARVMHWSSPSDTEAVTAEPGHFSPAEPEQEQQVAQFAPARHDDPAGPDRQPTDADHVAGEAPTAVEYSAEAGWGDDGPTPARTGDSWRYRSGEPPVTFAGYAGADAAPPPAAPDRYAGATGRTRTADLPAEGSTGLPTGRVPMPRAGRTRAERQRAEALAGRTDIPAEAGAEETWGGGYDGSAGVTGEPVPAALAGASGDVAGTAGDVAGASGNVAGAAGQLPSESDRPGDGEPSGSAAPLRPGDVPQTTLAVWDEAGTRRFHDDWHEVKALFVDEPVRALSQAGALVRAAVNEVTAALLAEQERLDPLRTSSAPDTETMRIAMRRYREFLDRILAL